MLNLSNLFHRKLLATASEPNESKDLPCPDVSRNPQLIADVINQLSQQNAELTAVLLEGDIAPKQLRRIIAKPDTGLLYIEFNQRAADWAGKKLTLISTYHESRIAFSVTILAQCSLNSLELAWPEEMIQITSRQYYRFHPQHPVELRLESGASRMMATLYDISEGGLGLLIRAEDYPKLQAIYQQPITISIASLVMTVQLQPCSHIPASQAHYLRLGFAMQSNSEQELAKLRKFMMLLQAKH